MVKITVASVDRCELENELMEKKDTKYIVLYPTYEALKPDNADEDVDYSVGSTFIASSGSNDVCTNLCGVLAEGGFTQRYFSFRAVLASAAVYCKSKKINTIIIPACMLKEIVSEDINTAMINSAIKEILNLAGCPNCNVVITTMMTHDDEVILNTIGRTRGWSDLGGGFDRQAKKAIAKKNKKGEKKSKKNKKKKNKKRK